MFALVVVVVVVVLIYIMSTSIVSSSMKSSSRSIHSISTRILVVLVLCSSIIPNGIPIDSIDSY
jgi:uncharacterized membrane protein (DUF373 family)